MNKDEQKKAESLPGNGEHYFCGSSLFYLEHEKETIAQSDYDYPIALVGQNIGINAGSKTICVLTGEATEEEMKQTGIYPTYTFPSIKELYEALK